MKPVSLPKQSAPDPAYVLPMIGTLAVFAMYMLVNGLLYGRVKELMEHVANPYFVILLVVVTIIGQLLTLWQTWRLLGEGNYLGLLVRRFKSSETQDRRAKLANLNDTLAGVPAGLEVRTLFQQLLSKDGTAPVHDPARLQHQADSFALEIQRRTTLTQYIANTLIGLGLFGTFLGLIVTLKEVAALIGLFGVAGSGGSDMMAQFFQKMSAPLAGMGDAFVASLLGLGGSIVNNVQLLATRKLQRVLCNRAEAAYMSVADAVCVPADGEPDEQQMRNDFSVAQAQLQEIRSIRNEMHQQTEAVLLASSRMRQASEPLVKCLEGLEKRTAAQAQDRPQLEQIAATMEQRLGALVHKFEDTQQAHQGLLTSVRAMEVHLAGIAMGQAEVSDDQRSVSRKLSDLITAATQEAELARQAMREHADTLRSAVGQDLRQVSELIESNLREQREQGQALSSMQTSTRSTQVAVETVGAQLLQQGQQLQPHLIEIIARIDKLDMNAAARAQAALSATSSPAPQLPEEQQERQEQQDRLPPSGNDPENHS
ncbi:centriolin protein [Herbaspirillum huttiense]|uniref:Centriolin protein n=2 Tax=Herbaspirillum huttiense TaxID=863372 RepID=A0AAJ2LS51_9BURK|nr:centriolin protein [Herbaspirillum huttiense]MDR9834755.1 centriolin protein [Herbaspirillum huttiense]